jgi:hypothetical protein
MLSSPSVVYTAGDWKLGLVASACVILEDTMGRIQLGGNYAILKNQNRRA